MSKATKSKQVSFSHLSKIGLGKGGQFGDMEPPIPYRALSENVLRFRFANGRSNSGKNSPIRISLRVIA